MWAPLPCNSGTTVIHVPPTLEYATYRLLLGAAREIEVGVVLFADGMMTEVEEKALSKQQMLSDTMDKRVYLKVSLS